MGGGRSLCELRLPRLAEIGAEIWEMRDLVRIFEHLGLEDLDLAHELDLPPLARGCLQSGATRGGRVALRSTPMTRSSEFIKGHQRSSEVIRGHQRSSGALREGISGNQLPHAMERPEDIEELPSRAIKHNQGRSHLPLAMERPEDVEELHTDELRTQLHAMTQLIRKANDRVDEHQDALDHVRPYFRPRSALKELPALAVLGADETRGHPRMSAPACQIRVVRLRIRSA